MRKYYKWTTPCKFVLHTPYYFDEGRGLAKLQVVTRDYAKFFIYGGKIVRIKIKEGYSWDGCSPSIKVFGGKFGTYDGDMVSAIFLTRIHKVYCGEFLLGGSLQRLYFASLIHDVLCQYSDDLKPYTSMTQKDYDKIFFEYCKQAKFRYADLYYRAVRTFQTAQSFVGKFKSLFK